MVNTTAAPFDVTTFDVAEFDRILAQGLSKGLGERGDQVCIEAAICQVLHLPHGDDPGCVAAAVRSFKITLNDAAWSSPKARAAGLHDLGLAQLGSAGVVSDAEFAKRIAENTIRVLIPKLFRQVFPKDEKCMAAALRCELEGSEEAASEAAARASEAAWAAARAAASNEYLILSASLALAVLRDLNSPGVKLLRKVA
jgi:hypothetical protein